MMATLLMCADLFWGDAAHNSILCLATFRETGPVHFCAMASDLEPHGRDLWKRLNAGEFGTIGAYVATPIPPASKSSGTQKV